MPTISHTGCLQYDAYLGKSVSCLTDQLYRNESDDPQENIYKTLSFWQVGIKPSVHNLASQLWGSYTISGNVVLQMIKLI